MAYTKGIMIQLALQCVCGAQMEGWFQSEGDYREQKKAGLVHCPHCKSTEHQAIFADPMSASAILNETQNQGAQSPLIGDPLQQFLLGLAKKINELSGGQAQMEVRTVALSQASPEMQEKIALAMANSEDGLVLTQDANELTQALHEQIMIAETRTQQDDARIGKMVEEYRMEEDSAMPAPRKATHWSVVDSRNPLSEMPLPNTSAEESVGQINVANYPPLASRKIWRRHQSRRVQPTLHKNADESGEDLLEQQIARIAQAVVSGLIQSITQTSEPPASASDNINRTQRVPTRSKRKASLASPVIQDKRRDEVAGWVAIAVPQKSRFH